jgi:hypothetical protein
MSSDESLYPPRPILQGFRKVRCSHQIGTRDISNRSSQFQNAMIRPPRKLQLAHRCLHKSLCSTIELAELAYLGGPHIGIGKAAWNRPKTRLLTLPRRNHPCPDGMRRLT